MNPKVNFFFDKAKNWRPEYEQLRRVVLDTGLTEELKWGCPCYTSEGANVVLIHGFKNYCALLFMKGALLKDNYSMLVKQTENVQAARQLRFTNVNEIVKQKKAIKSYILQAIEIEKSGQKVPLKKTAEFAVPAEFKNALAEMPDLKKAFYKLTPGRQRAYLLHFSSAKQSQTRLARIEKNIPHILDGKGLDDR